MLREVNQMMALPGKDFTYNAITAEVAVMILVTVQSSYNGNILSIVFRHCIHNALLCDLAGIIGCSK